MEGMSLTFPHPLTFNKGQRGRGAVENPWPGNGAWEAIWRPSKHIFGDDGGAFLVDGLLEGIGPAFPFPPYLAVQAQENEHHEEKGCPQRGQWHHGDRLGIGNEGQART